MVAVETESFLGLGRNVAYPSFDGGGLRGCEIRDVTGEVEIFDEGGLSDGFGGFEEALGGLSFDSLGFVAALVGALLRLHAHS